MADVKPAEVSAILREQLSGFRSETELQEVGTVLSIGDGIARIYGLNGVQYGELIEFEGGLQGIALNLEEDNVGAVLLGRSSSAYYHYIYCAHRQSDKIKVYEMNQPTRQRPM